MIKVTVQREDRIHAINKLASAVEILSKALCTAPKVEIYDNTLADNAVGIQVDTADNVERTEIIE
jgi:hypothetical protein